MLIAGLMLFAAVLGVLTVRLTSGHGKGAWSGMRTTATVALGRTTPESCGGLRSPRKDSGVVDVPDQNTKRTPSCSFRGA